MRGGVHQARDHFRSRYVGAVVVVGGFLNRGWDSIFIVCDGTAPVGGPPSS